MEINKFRTHARTHTHSICMRAHIHMLAPGTHTHTQAHSRTQRVYMHAERSPTHVKGPIVYVRVRWIAETPK